MRALENVDINEKKSSDEAEEEKPLTIIEMDAKQNDNFRKLFSNIGLKLTVNRGSDEKEPDSPEEINRTAKETTSDQAPQNIDLYTHCDNDSTTCPTMSDGTSEDILENTRETKSQTKEEAESDCVDTAATSPETEEEKAQEEPSPEEDKNQTFSSSPEPEEVMSPVKRFFTTGIFSGLRKKKKSTEEEPIEKELVETDKETEEIEEETGVNQQIKDTGVLNDDAANDETACKNETTGASSAATVNQPEILSSQEKVQESPFRRLFSSSSLKKHSKKPRSRRSSTDRISDSGEHSSDQMMPAKPADNQKDGESPSQPSLEAAVEEESAWVSFKKLLTPKKNVKKSSLTNGETKVPGSEGERKRSEGEQISDESTEEGKSKRKDSSVSWEAVLCGSGKKNRSRKTSDSEDETPPTENENKKQEMPLERSNEVIKTPSISSKQTESSDDEGGSTWKSFKKLVTPKKKVRNEEDKDNVLSDNETAHDESSFSIKTFLSGRKKKKSVVNQDLASSDEADKEEASEDEDSETPAVVPLSEFEIVEAEVHIKTPDNEQTSPLPKELATEPQQDIDPMTKPIIPTDSLQVQDTENNMKSTVSTTAVAKEEPEEVTESISTHQLLSDIPEEGIITETVDIEEVVRDDTIAEDVIEITSEAITAPEPVDETEMVSAVSQLTHSSHTSGNITPVLLDSDIKDTEEILHQVVETFTMSPRTEPLFSEDISPERIAGSITQRVLEKCVKEEKTLLEIHRRSDVTTIITGLSAEEVEWDGELAGTTQTESISEVKEVMSTEITSEVPTEEFVSADISADEVHEASVSCPAGGNHNMETTDATEAEYTETEVEVNLIVAEEGYREEGPHDVNIDSGGAELDKKVEEDEDEGASEILQNDMDKIQDENRDQPPEEEEESQEDHEKQDATRESDEENDTEDVVEVTDAVRPREEVEFTGIVDAGKENKTHNIVAQTEESELELVSSQTAVGDLVEESTMLFKLKGTEDAPEEESNIDQSKKTEPVSESFAKEETKLVVNVETAETKPSEEPEILEAALTNNTDSKVASSQMLEKDEIWEDIPAEESVTDKSKDESEVLLENSTEVQGENCLQTDAAKLEPPEEPDVVEDVQTDTFDVDNIDQISKNKATDIVGVEETDIVEPLRESEPLAKNDVQTEAEQQEDADQTVTAEVLLTSTLELGTITELMIERQDTLEEVQTQETDIETSQVKTDCEQEVKTETKSDDVHYDEVLEEGQAAMSVTAEECGVLTSQAVEVPEDITAVGTVSDRADQTADTLSYDYKVVDIKEVVQEHTFDMQEGSEKEVLSESTAKTEEVSDEPREETQPHIITREPEESAETESEALEAPKGEMTDLDDGCAQTSNTEEPPKIETVTVEITLADEGDNEPEISTEDTTTDVQPLETQPKAQVSTSSFVDTGRVEVLSVEFEEEKLTEEDSKSEIESTQPDVLQGKIEPPSLEVKHAEIKEETTLCANDVEAAAATSATEDCSVVIMNLPLVQFEDNHQIQVQVEEVDAESAEETVDAVVKVCITETTAVIDVCQETADEVEELCATVRTEATIEEGSLIVHEFTEQELQHESMTFHGEQEVLKEADTEPKHIAKEKFTEQEDKSIMEDTATDNKETAAEHQESKDLRKSPDRPEKSEVSFHENKDKSAEPSTDGKSKVDVVTEQIKLPSPITKEVPNIEQSQILTPNSGLVIPQNTGILSSLGSVESPSSLSLEFKLNIQFAQTKEQTSPPPTLERGDRVKKTDVSDVGVQAVEPEIVPGVNQKTAEVVDFPLQGTEIAVLENLDPREPVIQSVVLLDVGMQTVEPEEQTEPSESVLKHSQVTETVLQMEQSVVFQTPEISEVPQPETQEKEPVKHTDEENDQDVWMDAEEDIDTLEGTEPILPVVDEPTRLHTESHSEENVLLEQRSGKAPEFGSEEKQNERQRGDRGLESEGEDCAAALEPLDNTTTNTTVMEYD